MSAPSGPQAQPAAAPGSPEAARGLPLGFLAMLPLAFLYEWGLEASGGTRANAAQVLMSLVLEPLGEWALAARWWLLAALGLAALWFARREQLRVRAGLSRILLEGLLAAVLLGPLLVGAMALLGSQPGDWDVSWDAARSPPSLALAALVCGGAMWEELAFRVGILSILFLLARRFSVLAGMGPRASRWLAEMAAIAGSAAVFAAFHFRVLTGWMWSGGQEFSRAGFTWLVLAGMLLGILYRWRGPGVAAWAHAWFNLALLIGIDPDVLQGA